MMCVYNTKESDLREAIESILNQTFQDFELLVVDDGSTLPHVKKTIESYKDKRIKYFYKENQGIIGYARDFALSKCKGEYIAVMDSDDIALPERFEKEVRFLDNHPDFFCVGGGLETFPQKEIWILSEYPCILDCLINSPVLNSSSMFRREMVEKYNLHYSSDYVACEDYDFWAQAMMKGLKFYNFQEILYLYRRENQGVTSTTKVEILQSDSDKVRAKLMRFIAGDSIVWQQKLSEIIGSKNTYWLKVFNLPFVKVKVKRNVTKYYLFGKIRIFKLKKEK